MLEDTGNNEYFEWLFSLACRDRYSDRISYRKLLMELHNIDFRYSIPMDENRAKDGLDLRYRFSIERGYDERYIDAPCSVLEMILALSIRCEENIMDNTEYGNRTDQWFWDMITNLGLGSMYDSNYDKIYVRKTVERFLNRDYEPNGKGGLFTIRNCNRDLRQVEIWYQLNWYLNSIV